MILASLFFMIGMPTETHAQNSKKEDFEKSIFAYDPKPPVKVTSNFEMSSEDADFLAGGVKNNLLDYIPSSEVFQSIGGYLKGEGENAPTVSADIFIEAPFVRLDLQYVAASLKENVKWELFHEDHFFGRDLSYEDVAKWINSSPSRDLFDKRCSADQSAINLDHLKSNVEVVCTLRLPNINFRKKGDQRLYVERQSGSEVLYSEKRTATVSTHAGNRVYVSQPLVGGTTDGWGFPKYLGVRYACNYSGSVQFAEPIWSQTEKDRCMKAAVDLSEVPSPGGGEGATQTPSARALDKALLRLGKAKSR